MTGPYDGFVDELAPVAAALVPHVAAHVPAEPSARLGRLGSASVTGTGQASPRGWVVSGPATVLQPPTPYPGIAGAGLIRPLAIDPGTSGFGAADEPGALVALRGVPALLSERLLGALELHLPSLSPDRAAPTLTGVAGLMASLTRSSPQTFAMMSSRMESETVVAVRMLEQAHPGVIALITELTTRLAHHPGLANVLTVPADLTDEAAIAAAHGAGYLALAVAVADTVLDEVSLARPAAVVGAAVGVAALLLPELPMPSGYPDAVLAKARADYRLPVASFGTVPVADHRFALLELGAGPVGDEVATLLRAAEFDGNGLVVPVPGGAVIRTGVAEGSVQVLLRVLAEPPPGPDDTAWDEVVEVSWNADRGAASVVGPEQPGDPNLLGATPPWPGDYRLRVQATGRDDAETGEGHPTSGSEHYELMVWAAPAAPQVVHRHTDRLGHRLRGAPEPVRRDRPELAYSWIRRSVLSEAATVTIVTGSPWAEVLQAFGADPDHPEPAEQIMDQLMREQSLDPWLMATDTGDAVIVVEPNGWEGTAPPVLRRASAAGRAASMYWSIDAVTKLSFAERGQLLTSFELLGDPSDEVADAGVLAALAGLDLADYRNQTEKGLAAVERFTDHGFTAGDLARLEETAIGYRILPQLP